MSLLPVGDDTLAILVLLGGPSAEREISLKSGFQVIAALTGLGHCVAGHDPLPNQLPWSQIEQTDVIFNALHGTYGEDGGIQQELDARGRVYTGSGAAASAAAFDKSIAKSRFQIASIRVPASITVEHRTPTTSVDLFLRQSPGSWFVKPARQGSSLGVTRVDQPQQIPAALQVARRYDSQVLIEQAIVGREFTLSLLDDISLPLIEICTASSFFDYRAKYADPGTQLIAPGDLSSAARDDLVTQGRRAYQELGCRGLARVDLMLDSQDRAWVLEVNTLPGMTASSLAPRAARAAGWTFPTLCEQLCRRALQSAQMS